MKTALLLCALFFGAPVWAQNQTVAPLVAPQTEPLAQRWEFTPDFLSGQHQIAWRIAPDFEDNLLVATLTDAGVTTSEIINFPDAGGKTVAVLRATFDKKGQLQKQELRDAQGQVTQRQTDFEKSAPLSVENSVLSLQTIVAKGVLQTRILSLNLPNLPTALSSRYNEHGRRTSDEWIYQTKGRGQRVTYDYNARGLEKITVTGDNAATLSVERDAKGKTRATRLTRNGLLEQSVAPLRDLKGNVIGTRVENYRSGILSETLETYLEGDEPLDPNRPRPTFSERTTTEGGQQTTEKNFDFSVGIGKPIAAPARALIAKRTVYAGAKPTYEEIARDGVLTQRSDFNDNGVISKVTQFNADGNVASTFDVAKIPYADGAQGIIRKP